MEEGVQISHQIGSARLGVLEPPSAFAQPAINRSSAHAMGVCYALSLLFLPFNQSF